MEFYNNLKYTKISRVKLKRKYIVLFTLLIFIYIIEFNSLANSFQETNTLLNETVNKTKELSENIDSTKNGDNLDTSNGLLNQRDFDDESDDEEYDHLKSQKFVNNGTHNIINKNGNKTNNIKTLYSKDFKGNHIQNQEERTSKSNQKVKKVSESNITTIEEEIEIIKSKLMNSTFKLDDFYARTVFDKLFEIFEPASDKILDFLEVNKNLTRIIDTSKSITNIADSYGVLSYLWFYGIPNKRGRLEFPYGWPRNIDIALRYALKGATKFNCGFCYTMMGLLFAWGYPPLVNNTHGWIGIDNSTSKVDLLKYSASKNTYFLYQNPHRYTNNMDSEKINFPLEKNGFDLVSMNYALASKNKDIFGQLANSYYLRYSLSDISYQYNTLENSSSFSLHRVPRNLTSVVGLSSSSRCIVALEPLIFVASKTLGDSRDLFLPEISTLLRENKAKEHETKHYAEWVKSLAADRDPEGMTSLGELYYYGHEAGGIARDVNRAAQLWEESARRGDPQGALARAFLNLDGTIGTERDSSPYLRQVARNGEPSAAALANYYIYKLGLEVDKNSTIAGQYLKLAADLGDGNAQLILAHAYAGGKMGVIPPGGQNDTLALKYYKLSAEGGRTVAYFNSAVLTLKGSDKKYKTEESRCTASIDYLTRVVRKNNHVKFLSLLSRKSYENGDIVGSLLREMTLSEMGFIEGHINSQDLWKEKSILFYNNAIKKMINNINYDTYKMIEPVCKVSDLESVDILKDNYLNFLNIMNKIQSKLDICEVTVLDESNEKFSTLYPNKFDLEMSGISSKSFCLVKANRREVFFNVPINFDSSIIHLNSTYFKYYDMFNSQNATLRGKLDLNYSRNMSEKEKNRVSEFLNCWMRPKSYYDNLGKNKKPLLNRMIGDRIIDEIDDEESDQEEMNIFDRILELWQRPKSGSYRRYPKPWYKAFNKIFKVFKYVLNSAFFKSMKNLNSYFGTNINKNYIQKKEKGGLFSSIFLDLDEDFEIDEKKVPEIIQLQRNSSLWCSHYYTRRSSSNGDISSTQNLVQQFLEGSFGVNKDPVFAFKFIMQGVNSRDPKSILDYAIALNKGIGVKMDKPKSYRLLWHLMTRGPFNIEDILPKVPSKPKFTPSIFDTIREALEPLIKNNTNLNNTRIINLNNNNYNNNSNVYLKESKEINNFDFEDHYQGEDDNEEEQDQDQDQDQSSLNSDSKYKKGRRARMNDTINMNLKTQQDLATRISSFNILMILTLDWIYFNIVLRCYYSSLALKNQIWSSLFNLYYKNMSNEDLLLENKVVNSNINKSMHDKVLENENFNMNFSSYELIKNSIKDPSRILDTCNNNICNINKKIKSEIYCSLFRQDLCEYSETSENLKRNNKLSNNNEKNNELLEEDLILMIDEDPFPLLSKFRYISDEEYGRASNIWKASISIRLYYFILRIVIIIGTISVLIPLNIAITEKLSH
ncbi:uncharacterized protein cubi_01665 [Cryptosporidium ubiquitum]|uniref:Sel1 repeat-containing protein n=1 Tax=Cryptosporidium ubiquitum TaxID=857276 RepID=A0A1J4MGY0_9CRYT|nr:uncharacterized protein cubi_01665 [Cryptosporidium ubiquitum]OII72715.1 hypothetical protein cubi_01665 [Cryptosporidium ubiquitum]